jgi:AcrR family transcriptional regulator
MPRFSEKEKERIRLKLLEVAKHLFASLGLKKTSVEDLTKSVGIAQGTFYLFYPSKEELYLAILLQEEQVIRARISAGFGAAGRASKAAFKSFLRESIAILEANPFTRQLYSDDLMETLFRKLPEERLEQLFAEDADFFFPIITEAQRQGWMVNRKSETIVSLIRTIVLLSLQKKQIGEDRYEETMDMLLEFVAAGLILEKGESHD